MPRQLKDHIPLIALIVSAVSIFGAAFSGYAALRFPSREEIEAKYVTRESQEKDTAYLREMVSEVKATVNDTNRALMDFIREERRGR